MNARFILVQTKACLVAVLYATCWFAITAICNIRRRNRATG